MLGSNNAYVGIATFTGCAFFNRLAANSLPPEAGLSTPAYAALQLDQGTEAANRNACAAERLA